MSSIIDQKEFRTDNKSARSNIFVLPPSFKHAFKRLFDILISLLSLIILSPLFAFIAIAIKRDSPGPVFFKGERTGRGGKTFQILKFRTMYETPQSYSGPPITANGDSRITPIGTWLRKTKLNELPQLCNVLKGEMSLVGPRPEYPALTEQWPPDTRAEILSVRPGITSPASIAYRNEETMLNGSGFMDDYLRTILPDKLRLDQLYIRNQAFLTDLDVLAMTAIVFLPRLRTQPIKEKWLFNGPIYLFYHRVFSWFILDTLVTIFTVGISGIVWRISTPINLGVLTYLIVAITIAIITSLINTLIGLPRVKWRTASPTYIFDIAFSVGLTMVIIWAITRFWLTDPWIPFSMIWLIGLTTFLGLVAVRFRERLATGIANRWLILRGAEASFAERILIVGAGDLGEMAIWLLQRSAFAHLFGIVGIVDDDPRKQNTHILGMRVLGPTQNIPELVDKYNIGIIIYAISNIKPSESDRLLALCHATPARTVVIPDLVKVLEKSLKKMEQQESS